jgi:TraM recognition site of TraD and TraG
VIEATGRQSGGGNDSGYWENAVRQLILNACDLCYFARGKVGLADIRNVIGSIAQNRDEVRSEQWQKESFCYRLITEAEPKPREVNAQYDFNECVAYFLEEMPALSDRTRSVIVSMFSGMASYFLRGKLRKMFCAGLTLTPEQTWEQGKIVILDLPVKEFNNRGRAAQILFKYAYQRAIERRDVREHPRGCFIWADEAQNFVTPQDAQFCSTSRSSRCCTVYLSQSLPVYYNAFSASPERAKHDALALLGNMQVKFFHANTEQETCEWMSNLIGKYWVNKTSLNMNTNETSDKGQIGRVQSNSGIGTNQVMDHAIQPAYWQRMRTGGFRNKGLVDVVLHQGGRQWSTGENFLRLTFRQEGF